jgi:hypothetical protein
MKIAPFPTFDLIKMLSVGDASYETEDEKVIGTSILSTRGRLFVLAGSESATVEAGVLPRAYTI